MREMIGYTLDGEEMAKASIQSAAEQGRVVLRWSHGNWRNVAGIIVYPTAEDAAIEAKRDTREECWSMADEVWSSLATPADAWLAAIGMMSQC